MGKEDKELEFFYDEETDTFIWPDMIDVYIAVPTGQHITLPEDHLTKNTVEYKVFAIRRNIPQGIDHLGTGREAKVAVLVAQDHLELREEGK